MVRQLSLAQAFMYVGLSSKLVQTTFHALSRDIYFIFSKYAFLSDVGDLENQNYARKTNITVLLKDFTEGKLGDFDI